MRQIGTKEVAASVCGHTATSTGFDDNGTERWTAPEFCVACRLAHQAKPETKARVAEAIADGTLGEVTRHVHLEVLGSRLCS